MGRNMHNKWNRMNYRQVVLRACGGIVIVWVVLALCAGPPMKDLVKPRELANACSERMKAIAETLREFTKEHHDFPRGDDGLFLPDMLICNPNGTDGLCIQSIDSGCTLYAKHDGGSWQGFVWCKSPTREQIETFATAKVIDFPWQPTGKEWILMCHDENSIHQFRKVHSAIILFSTGDTLSYNCDDEYRIWLDTKFRRGESRIPEFMMRRLMVLHGAHQSGKE